MGDDATQDLVLRVVRKRIFDDAPQHLVDAIVSDANLACLEAPRKPTDMDKALAWVATVTANTLRTYFRKNAKDQRWLNREHDVEQVAAEELAPPILDARAEESSPLDMLDAWLDKVVARSPRDKETLAIVRHKARTKQTDEQLVAHFKLSSVSALSSRIHYFKTKYQDRRRRYVAQRQRVVALLLRLGKWAAALIALGLVAWWLWSGRRPERTETPPAPTQTRPGPALGGLPVTHPDPGESDAGGDVE